MLNLLTPLLAGIGLGVSVLSLAVYSLRLARIAGGELLPHRALYLAADLSALYFSAVWALLLALAAAGLTFDPVTSMALRWSTVIVPFFSMFLAFWEHEWAPLFPGLMALLLLPFFETAFGVAFPILLPVFLLAFCLYGLFQLLHSLRKKTLSLRSIQEAIDTLEEGLLFAEPDGPVVLCNSAMRALCLAICHEEPTDAAAFWSRLQSVESTDRLTKVESGESYLFRFSGGNTWTFHREDLTANGSTYVEFIALNVTKSDEIQQKAAAKRAELGAVALQLQQLEETIRKLQEEEARVLRGRQAFDTITEKMSALNRFFAEHYALPAETFDYKKLSELTAGLLQELDHRTGPSPRESLRLTESALRLLGVSFRCSGDWPEAAGEAVASIIREAAINAVLHGGAKTVTVTMESVPGSFLCRIENDGTPLSGTLTPGGGITKIRRLLFPLGGTLELIREPVFALTVRLPQT